LKTPILFVIAYTEHEQEHLAWSPPVCAFDSLTTYGTVYCINCFQSTDIELKMQIHKTCYSILLHCTRTAA